MLPPPLFSIFRTENYLKETQFDNTFVTKTAVTETTAVTKNWLATICTDYFKNSLSR